jgi:flagellar biogenesis protein FliO
MNRRRSVGAALAVVCFALHALAPPCLDAADPVRNRPAAHGQPAAVAPNLRSEARKLERPSQAAPATSNPARKSRTSASGNWANVFGALVIVVALIVGGAVALRKHVPLASRSLPVEVVQVLGRRSIDARHSIQLVRCGTRILILANSAQHGLQMLSEVTDPVEVDLLAGMCKQTETNSVTQNFAQFLWKQQDDAAGLRASGAPHIERDYQLEPHLAAGLGGTDHG